VRTVNLALTLAAALLLSDSVAAQSAAPRVLFRTSMGEFTIELNPERAPVSVANFLRYVNERHFDSTIIYRVVPGFVVQMGSYFVDFNAKRTHDPIVLEANNGLSNLRGTVAMARDTPNSATAEFFINLADNLRLNQDSADTQNMTGYAVFGQVVSGMEVMDQIALVPRGDAGPFPGATPVSPIYIIQATLVESAPSADPLAAAPPGGQPAPAPTPETPPPPAPETQPAPAAAPAP
jgi:cyclophilin family peptidyl-prolyl cis-trans isomerase